MKHWSGSHACGVRSILVVAALGALMLCAGCSHSLRHRAPYYENGPYQSEQPQGWLDEGKRVLVIGHEGDYSRIWTIDLIDAYVWDNDLESLWE